MTLFFDLILQASFLQSQEYPGISDTDRKSAPDIGKIHGRGYENTSFASTLQLSRKQDVPNSG